MADDRVGTYWAGTVRVCGAERWVDYASPHSRHPRWRRLPHRGAQHADLLAAADDKLDELARRLSSAHERVRQLAVRLARGRLPDFGHLHALTYLFEQLRERYLAPEVQGPRGALRCAEAPLRAALRGVEGVYWALAAARASGAPLTGARWRERARWLKRRPGELERVSRAVAVWEGWMRRELGIEVTAGPRRLRFGGGRA